MILIKPINVPTKGIGKYFGITCLQINIKTTSEATPTFYWEVKTQVDSIVNEVSTPTPGQTVLEGNISMTQEEYTQWSDDDNYVIDWALNKLGFEKE